MGVAISSRVFDTSFRPEHARRRIGKTKFWCMSVAIHLGCLLLLFQLSSQISKTTRQDNPASIELVYLMPDVPAFGTDQFNAKLIEQKDYSTVDNQPPSASKTANLEDLLLQEQVNLARQSNIDDIDALIEQPSPAKAKTASMPQELEILSGAKQPPSNRIKDSNLTYRKVLTNIEPNLLLEPNKPDRQIKYPSTPTIYSGAVLGASKRTALANMADMIDDFNGLPSSSCESRKKSPSLKSKLNQIDGDKNITISSLLGGNILYQIIKQDQRLNISNLLGGGLVNHQSTTVAQLLNMSQTNNVEAECASK